jgi:streptomycin 6-kinase
MIPEGLREKVVRVHGERGRRWLVTLPTLLAECRARWSLELGEPFENLSYNLAIPGRMSDGTGVVLKLGVPCDELMTEAAALSLFDGAGAARLLDHDAPRGILLMERVTPGTPLFKLQADIEATRTAARLMRRLWRAPPAGHSFPTLTVWFRAFARLRNRFDGGSGPFPSELVARAEHTFAELQSSSESSVLLHGDLHHANVLLSEEKGWAAIDPKGICGDAGYEVGPFMLNQLPDGSSDSATVEILKRRLSIFSDELQMSRGRLARWSFCHAVLSALWDFEESADWGETIRLALMLQRLG